MGISKTLHPAFFLGICGRKILEDFNGYINMYHLIYRGNAKLAKVSQNQLFSIVFYMNSNILSFVSFKLLGLRLLKESQRKRVDSVESYDIIVQKEKIYESQ